MRIIHFKIDGLKHSLFVLRELLLASLVMKLDILNEHNIKRHYKTKHISQVRGIQGQLQRGKISWHQNCLAQQ